MFRFFTSGQYDHHCHDRLYRYEEVVYSPGVDEWGVRLSGPGVLRVVLRQYEVVKRTRCGAWIDNGFGRRFINLEATKRFACNTVQEAAESFKARKEKQKQICLAKADQARLALNFYIPSEGWVREDYAYNLPRYMTFQPPSK